MPQRVNVGRQKGGRLLQKEEAKSQEVNTPYAPIDVSISTMQMTEQLWMQRTPPNKSQYIASRRVL